MRIGPATEVGGSVVVCIVGMHRSGTSLVARMMNLLGVDLGDRDDLMPAQPDNPEGFWENIHFARINEMLLNEAGGDWDCPPAEIPYSALPAYPEIRDRAHLLLRSFEGRKPWGWKEPRSSLTLDFWQSLIPDLRIIVCVRNPLEVAFSLKRRNGFSFALGLTLWTIYNRRILAATQRQQRLVIRYQACLDDPRAQAWRIMKFLQLPATDAIIANACNAGKTLLRHHCVSSDELVEAGVSDAVIDLYQTLWQEAGNAAPTENPATSIRIASGITRQD